MKSRVNGERNLGNALGKPALSETYFRLPEQFRSLEPVVRERIRSRLTRGKVECTLRYEPDVSAQGELILNEKLAKQLVTAANWVKMQSDEGKSTRLIFYAGRA